MPELPDLTLYLEALAERIVEERFEALELASPFVLRSVTPAAAELAGRRVEGLLRLGKRIVIALAGEYFVVVHLMVAGRLHFQPAGGRDSRRSGGRRRPAQIAAIAFTSGKLLLTEAGKKRRASIHLVHGKSALATHDPGGIEPLTADLAAFRLALAAENHTLKRALTDPHLVAGIGNAYSDEILHAARLSPFARTAELSDDGWQRLYAATRQTLTTWTERLRRGFAGRFPDQVTAFRPEMAVHGRFGLPCPVCATPVQRIVYAENEANYCPLCQTGGKLLADRVLSRLLHGDWPKSLEELEQRKSAARAGTISPPRLRPGPLALALALLALAPAAAAPVPSASAEAAPAPSAEALLGRAPATEAPLERAPATEPPLGREVIPPLPLPGLPPDPARLAEARALLAPGSAESEVGGYLLLSDLGDPPLLARIAAVVGGLEALYAERYGRRPIGAPREAIVLFSAEESYRRFQAGDPRLAGLAISTGLAGKGIVATYRGARSEDELLGTLVHELGHLLNRRALGPSLPSWLDEGLADDLGASRIDREGRLAPGSWSRTVEVRGPEIRITGGEAALRDLAELFGPDGGAPGRLDLGALLGLDWEGFVAEPGVELHYAAAASFIRMLLAAPAKAALFRGWLAAVAAGGPAEAEELRRALGREWPELERDLGLWSRSELARLPPLPAAGARRRPSRSTLSATPF